MRCLLPLAPCLLALCLQPVQAQTGPQPPSSASPSAPAGPSSPATREMPVAPARSQPISPIGDTAAYVLSQFGPSFRVDPTVGPLFTDLDGDGIEDVVLFATSAKPLANREQFQYRVEDPYDDFFGAGDVSITSEFNLHFDGSGRDILIVFGWRTPPTPPAHNRRVSKFVLINTPFETVSVTSLTRKKKNLQAIEAVDHTHEHALVLWDGKHWRWQAQGTDDDEVFGHLHTDPEGKQ